MRNRKTFAKLTGMVFDLVVIGGGINGAGIARDAALRGLSVAIVEREDWGAGTTGSSTRMVHGGLRYLLYDVPTTKHSSIDAGAIRRIAPHVTWRIPFLWPLFGGSRFMTEATEAFLSAYDPHAKQKGGLQHSRLTAEEARSVEPGLAPGIVGALTLDEWGCDVYRLAALNALAAREAGARLYSHCEVIELLRSGRDIRGVRVRDRIDGSVFEIEARLTINATGPWAGQLAGLAGADVRMRPGKGIHITFERRIGNYGMILEGVDGRVMFLVPHGAETIVGTTDTDYYGDPAHADLGITHDEIEYVIEAAAHAIPQAKEWRPLRAWAGVRNTLFEWGVESDDLSRRHEVIDHGERDGVGNFISILGGKLAAYRQQAEDAVDLSLSLLGRTHVPTRTTQVPLPGASAEPDFQALAAQFRVPAWVIERVWRRIGDRINVVFANATISERVVICRSEGVTAAELRYAIEQEGCRTLEDLHRHAHVGAGSCDGSDCGYAAAHIAADLLGWNAARLRAELEHFMDQRWIGRRPVLTGATLAQEEMIRGLSIGRSV